MSDKALSGKKKVSEVREAPETTGKKQGLGQKPSAVSGLGNQDKQGNVVAMTENLLSLGSEVRQLRKARCMTLKELSSASQISLSHLSAIERGASKPSVDVIAAIADALSVSSDWFFARRPGAGPMERAYVVRKHNRRNLNSLYGQSASELGYTDSLLSSSIGGRFYMGMAVYAPDADGPEQPLLEHSGEQHGLVIEGELEMQIGDEIITLRAGDSYSFDAKIPHHARNRSNKTACLMWAVSPVVIPKDVVQQDETSSGCHASDDLAQPAQPELSTASKRSNS